MKEILLFIFLITIESNCMLQKSTLPNGTKIYLVRHAEKERGSDPVLTIAGYKRAGDLMRILKDKNVRHIYVTNSRRSRLTADSLRLQSGIDTVHYAVDTTGEDLINKIKSNHDIQKVILVVGHSNTIPAIIKALGVKNYPAHDIPDDEFDNLYLVEYKADKIYFTQQKYGESK